MITTQRAEITLASFGLNSIRQSKTSQLYRSVVRLVFFYFVFLLRSLLFILDISLFRSLHHWAQSPTTKNKSSPRPKPPTIAHWGLQPPHHKLQEPSQATKPPCR